MNEPEVVMMNPKQNNNHLRKISQRLNRANIAKAKLIDKNECLEIIETKIKEIEIEHQYYKRSYQL